MANTGVGATVVFSGATSFTADWRSIGPALDASVEVLDNTSLSSVTYKEWLPDDLVDTAPIPIQCFWNYAAAPPTAGQVPTCTITFPMQAGQTTAGKIVGTAIITNVTEPELVSGTLLMGTVTIKFDGKTGPTRTNAS